VICPKCKEERCVMASIKGERKQPWFCSLCGYGFTDQLTLQREVRS